MIIPIPFRRPDKTIIGQECEIISDVYISIVLLFEQRSNRIVFCIYQLQPEVILVPVQGLYTKQVRIMEPL